MLMRRTPMKPGKGFKSRGSWAGAGSRAYQDEQDEGHHYDPGQDASREARLEARAARQIASALETAELITTRAVVAMGPATSGITIEKEHLVRSEPYRRLVAQLPCIWCGICGYSQHAHLNLGKGMGLKTDDRTGFPLCCSRPGIEGCHVAYDQYRLIEGADSDLHHEYGQEWGRITRHTILTSGLWPKTVPPWRDPVTFELRNET